MFQEKGWVKANGSWSSESPGVFSPHPWKVRSILGLSWVSVCFRFSDSVVEPWCTVWGGLWRFVDLLSSNLVMLLNNNSVTCTITQLCCTLKVGNIPNFFCTTFFQNWFGRACIITYISIAIYWWSEKQNT